VKAGEVLSRHVGRRHAPAVLAYRRARKAKPRVQG
jgi:hypothetical protein